MTYLQWNDRIAEYFFSPTKAGRKVSLFATHELIDRLGQASSGDFKDFITAVKTGPTWAHRSGLCQCAVEALRDWRARRLEYPPYVAYLALFVIAGGTEDEDFPSHAYYPRLRRILGYEPEARALPSFDRMLELWDDLEKWSNVDRDGELGVFQTRMLGSLINVGVPRSQTLLSEEERHNLPTIFSLTGFDATCTPSEHEMAKKIASSGMGILRKRTISILKSTEDTESDARHALIDALFEELVEWNGETIEVNTDGDEVRFHTGTLRLCCDLDRTAKQARMSFRARFPGEFPEKEFLRLTGSSGGQSSEFVCEEWGRGWSQQLERNSEIVNASDFDWTNPFQLTETGGAFRLRFPGSRVRIFVEGREEGLPGLVEMRRLPSLSGFYLFATADVSGQLEQWGSAECVGWKDLIIADGLPRGWRIFHASKARSDLAVRAEYPMLALPSCVSISLSGGIRVAGGNRFFEFAPPRITVEGANPDQVTFNGVEASYSKETPGFEIPSEVRTLENEEPKGLLIEAKWEGRILDRRTIYLMKGGWQWTAPVNGPLLNSFGTTKVDANGGPDLWGAQVKGVVAAPFDFATAMPEANYGSVYYLGREAGQIVHGRQNLWVTGNPFGRLCPNGATNSYFAAQVLRQPRLSVAI